MVARGFRTEDVGRVRDDPPQRVQAPQAPIGSGITPAVRKDWRYPITSRYREPYE